MKPRAVNLLCCLFALFAAIAGRAADVEVVATLPHDRTAFTEGLFIDHGVLYESSGLNGQSRLAKIDLKTGKLLASVALDEKYFGEGAVALNGRIFQLTWKHEMGFIYDQATLRPLGTFAYTGEGWGLTTDGHDLIMSDGTDRLRWLDPVTFAVKKTLAVTWNGKPLKRINELEFVDGQIYANVWQVDYIVRIDAATGEVARVFDASGLLSPADMNGTDVLNGIAYDADTKAFYITGKNWPKLFQVKWRQ